VASAPATLDAPSTFSTLSTSSFPVETRNGASPITANAAASSSTLRFFGCGFFASSLASTPIRRRSSSGMNASCPSCEIPSPSIAIASLASCSSSCAARAPVFPARISFIAFSAAPSSRSAYFTCMYGTIPSTVSSSCARSSSPSRFRSMYLLFGITASAIFACTRWRFSKRAVSSFKRSKNSVSVICASSGSISL